MHGATLGFRGLQRVSRLSAMGSNNGRVGAGAAPTRVTHKCGVAAQFGAWGWRPPTRVAYEVP